MTPRDLNVIDDPIVVLPDLQFIAFDEDSGYGTSRRVLVRADNIEAVRELGPRTFDNTPRILVLTKSGSSFTVLGTPAKFTALVA